MRDIMVPGDDLSDDERIRMTKRRIIIGDIHGCFDELENTVRKTGYREGIDELIFVGDLFDRGKQSAEVYRYVSELKEKNRDTVSIVYGNHEDMLVHSMNSDPDMDLWNLNGAESTKESFAAAGIDVVDIAAWIYENTIVYYECPEFFVCHGGTEIEDPGKARKYDLIWDRATFAIGNRYTKLMIIGHTPIEKPTWKCRPDRIVYNYDETYELPEKGIMNIDTGCVFHGHLTAMVIGEGKFRLISERSVYAT